MIKNPNRFCEYRDMYNIYNLITKINKCYKLVFDKKDKLFIVINSAKNNEICYKTNIISAEILNILNKTRIENIQYIIKDIDKNNELILSKNQMKFKDDLMVKMKDILSFSKRVSDISNQTIKKIIGEKGC